jgi:hypothetical protein
VTSYGRLVVLEAYGFGHRVGHVWPRSMMAESLNTPVVRRCYMGTSSLDIIVEIS